jgi:hypothetical protein
MLSVLSFYRKIPCFLLDLVCLLSKYLAWSQKWQSQIIVDDQQILVAMDGVINYVRVYNTTEYQTSTQETDLPDTQSSKFHRQLFDSFIHSHIVTLEGLC